MVLESGSDSFQIRIPGEHLVSKPNKKETVERVMKTEQSEEDKVMHSTRYNAGERYNLLIMCPYCSRRYAYKETMQHHIHAVHTAADGTIKDPISVFRGGESSSSSLLSEATVTEEDEDETGPTVEPTVTVKQEPIDEESNVEVIETPELQAEILPSKSLPILKPKINLKNLSRPSSNNNKTPSQQPRVVQKKRTPDWKSMPVTGINNKTDHRSKFKIYNKKTMKLVGKDGKLIDFVYMSNASKLNGQKVFYANRVGRPLPQNQAQPDSETATVMEFAEGESPLIKSEYIDPDDEPCTVTAFTDSEGEDDDDGQSNSVSQTLPEKVPQINVQQTPIFTRSKPTLVPSQKSLPVLAPKPTVENQYWKTIAVEKTGGRGPTKRPRIPPPVIPETLAQSKQTATKSALKVKVGKTVLLKSATVPVKIGRISGFKIAKPLSIKKTPTC
ncbi:Oidioi.mRNA.OKI2018_I69.PAR.g9719.t1.cds [Oikopleura dioica]|uniref:Oidioi.mRNA.OKI2018_I69.PAR.g9719.t1.cds n=1 Tax=Oikopleura dioica TaxID=34765 RepID=A0ABN7RLY7_OIKDI|nr:Oidioi.mRNA.OKI2018_I69.PAR.g9719.t1.cds [Oikopleura dioica]